MNSTPVVRRLEQNAGMIVLALLLIGCWLVVRAFVSAFLWAAVLCVTSWPLYQRLLGVLHGRRTTAAFLMSCGMVLVVLVPFLVIGLGLADNLKAITGTLHNLVHESPPAPPEFLHRLPVVGEPIAQSWQGLAQDTDKLLQTLKQWVEPVGSGLLAGGLVLGRGLAELGMSILIAFFLFRDGAQAGEWLTHAVRQVSGPRGLVLLDIAGRTVRGVVYGILGTALVQATMAGLGFLVAGVPAAGLLALLTFFLSVVPLGPPLVWVPAALWLFHQGSNGWGIFMLIWGTGVSSVDNVVKPWLISQGSDLPFILIFLGVLGGALAFGFIGVFLGPTLLAVGYRLIEGWITTGRGPGGSSGKIEGESAAVSIPPGSCA